MSVNVTKRVANFDGAGSETSEDANVYIERGSLIQLQCKRGSVTTIENYRVLCPFTKFIINGISVLTKQGLCGRRMQSVCGTWCG